MIKATSNEYLLNGVNGVNYWEIVLHQHFVNHTIYEHKTFQVLCWKSWSFKVMFIKLVPIDSKVKKIPFADAVPKK